MEEFMAQTFGILGFLLALTALFLASEVIRRTAYHQTELQAALFKTLARVQKLEGSVFHVEKLAAEIRYQRKRQAQTITALAQKGEILNAENLAREHEKGSGEPFTPSIRTTAKSSRKTG